MAQESQQDESLTDKFWKLASYSAYDLLGFGAENNATKPENNDKKKPKTTKKDEIWPSFVCSKSDNKPWGGYDEPNAQDFDVRGKNYLNDRIKIKSKSSLFKLANLELYNCSVSESYHIVKNNKSWYFKHNKQLPNDTFFLIYNMQLSSLNTAVVATFVIKTNQSPNNYKNNKQQIPKEFMINDEKLIDDMLANLEDDDDDDSSTTSGIYYIICDCATTNHLFTKQTKTEDDKQETNQQKQSLKENEKKPPKKEEKEEEEKEKEKEEVSSSEIAQKQIKFTVEDIESIPNIEQKIIHNDGIIENKKDLWCPKLGYKPYDEEIWEKFLFGDELFINQRLKIIPKIVEGSWYFTFPQRPALLGMKTPQRCYRGNNYLEIDCEADQSLIASQITKAAYHISTYLVVDIMLTIEGQSKKQLPERCIAGFQIRYVDSTKAIKLSHDDDDDNDDDSSTDNNDDDDDNLDNLE